MKASVKVVAPARTAKAASVAVARIQGDEVVPAAANPAPSPAANTAGKPAAKAAAQSAGKVPTQPAAQEAAAAKPAAKDAPKPASKEAPKPAAKPAPASAAPAEVNPALQAKPADEPPVAKAAAVPPAMKVAADAPPAVATAPGTDQAAAAARQVAPPARPAPPPGHVDRRPGPADRIPPRPPSKAEIFVEGDYVVYPTHGVGKVERIAVEEIAGHRLELIHITFEENRMTLRVPVAKARSAGLRKLATRKLFDEAMTVLKGRARIKRTMWSRRAQEYEAKINSGDPLAIAEVVRDLHRNAGQPDQSFSERQIYEAAMDRLAAELAALDKTDKPTAVTKLGDFLKTV